jgi:hypothetical protein
MPFDRGITAVGSFHAIRISPPRQAACWTYMLASGKAGHSRTANS